MAGRPASDRERQLIAAAVSRAARHCSTEKAIGILACNTRFSIAEIRDVVTASERTRA